ncbi:MAG: hypothetical protein ACTSV7_07795, partial [Candidatus Baldrarchaeia archaeon]
EGTLVGREYDVSFRNGMLGRFPKPVNVPKEVEEKVVKWANWRELWPSVERIEEPAPAYEHPLIKYLYKTHP